MSGPIIRKYGFPNFEQIFGKESPKHGLDSKPPAASGPLETESGAESSAIADHPGEVTPNSECTSTPATPEVIGLDPTSG